MLTITITCIGYACRADKNPYPHDRHAEKNPYRHDRRADKNPYQHDRFADSQCPFSSVVHHLHYRKSCLSENMGVSQIWPTTWDFVNVLVPDVKTIHWV